MTYNPLDTPKESTHNERQQALDHLVEMDLVEYKEAAGLKYVAITPLGLRLMGALELLKLYNEVEGEQR